MYGAPGMLLTSSSCASTLCTSHAAKDRTVHDGNDGGLQQNSDASQYRMHFLATSHNCRTPDMSPYLAGGPRLWCERHSHAMLAFLEDLVRRMSFIWQYRDVMQRRDIVHDLIAHEGVSVDEGDGLFVARLVSHNHKPFQNRIVPPSLFHQVAARSSIASDGFLPRLDRHGAIVARRRQRSDCLSRAQRCCQERRPLRLALARGRL
jgi:hypothetical protein